MCSLHQAWWKTQHSLHSEVSQVELKRNPKETIQVWGEGQEGKQGFAQMKSKFDAHEKLLKKLLKYKEYKKKARITMILTQTANPPEEVGLVAQGISM